MRTHSLIAVPFTETVRRLAAALALIALLAGPAWAQTVQLNGTVAQDALNLPNYGDLSTGQGLPLQIWFKPRNRAALDKLLASQQDPRSPDYQQWLTPQEYAGRFGITRKQFDRLSQWLTDRAFRLAAARRLKA